jgi:short subunit dehydrogenase-like uncharacterized protein
MDKHFDIVVYGATGFTGTLVCEYLHSQYRNSNIRWAIAGRNQDKLESLKAHLGLPEQVAVLVADGADCLALTPIVKDTKVIIAAAGPYQLYGDELVGLCAQLGTDYVDLCGEPTWMHQTIAAHHKTAQASGARIVHSCGFDSIPFDMGVFFLQDKAMQYYNKPMPRVKARVRNMQGQFSGGTAASLQATMAATREDKALAEIMRNPFSLCEGFSGPEQPPAHQIYYDDALQSWTAPFIMGVINSKNIHRSNLLLDHYYASNFSYDEMILTGDGEQGEKIAHHVANDTSLSGPNAPKPGEGPSAEARANGSYEVMFIGSNGDHQIIVSVGANEDPGYGSTSKMLVESALCLAFDDLATPGGVMTPAPAMGEALIKRLTERAGLWFKVEHNS